MDLPLRKFLFHLPDFEALILSSISSCMSWQNKLQILYDATILEPHSPWIFTAISQNLFIRVLCPCFILLLFCFVNALRLTRSSSKLRGFQKQNAAPTAIDSLLQIFNPTCSRWPTYYTDAASKAHASSDKTVHLRLDIILHHLSSGTIELRDPNTMTDLLNGHMTMLNWAIVISGDRPFDDDKLSRASLGLLRDILRIQDFDRNSDPLYGIEWPSFVSTLDDSRTRLSTSTSFQPLSLQEQHAGSQVTLDYIPTHLFSAVVREFQSSLHPQTTCSIEFSTQLTVDEADIFSGPLTRSHPSSLFLALLSIPHTAATCGSTYGPSTRKYSTAPLYTTLTSIINLLTSGPHALEVMHVNNVSHKHVRRLLSKNGPAGVDAARTKDGITRWQAALFNDVDDMRGLGVLGRYVVTVRKGREVQRH